MTTTVSFITLGKSQDSSKLENRELSDNLRTGNPIDIFLGKTSFTFVDAAKELESTERIEDNLYGSLRIFLLFGRFIGLIPIQGLFQTHVEGLKFR